MTTARSSSRSRSGVAIAIAAGLTALTIAPASAHRRDEYLQAARIAIEPGRVAIELDLTPGIALAERVLAEIDRDHNGRFDADETRAYSVRVLNEIRLDADGWPLPLQLIDGRFPTVQAVRSGEGTIELQLAAVLPPLDAGGHRVFYRNVHHPDIGVYLANALVPTSDRVTVVNQSRDVDQRELTVEYRLRGEAAPRLRWWLGAGLAGVMAMLAGIPWRRVRTRWTAREVR